VVLANARLSPTSVGRYQRFRTLFRALFQGDTWVAAQSAEDAARFLSIGADRERTHVVGNIKFDVSTDGATRERGRVLRALNWNDRPVWVAGSTHAGEEEEVLTAHAAVCQDVEGALLLLVPRHPQRFAAVADLLRRRGVSFERRSTRAVLRPETQVLLVDTVGELAMLYAAADVAFVGGSLVPVGGHNLLEPAALCVPVITGPSYENGKEIAELLQKEGGAIVVTDAGQLAAVLTRLFADPEWRQRVGASARQVVEVNRGSLARLLLLLEPMLTGKTGAAI
jgi:3-deoxy-D-manno-octulosonic-acid transferase